MSLATSRKLVMFSVEREGVMEAMVGGGGYSYLVSLVRLLVFGYLDGFPVACCCFCWISRWISRWTLGCPDGPEVMADPSSSLRCCFTRVCSLAFADTMFYCGASDVQFLARIQLSVLSDSCYLAGVDMIWRHGCRWYLLILIKLAERRVEAYTEQLHGAVVT